MRIAFPARDDQSIIGHLGKMKAPIVVDRIADCDVLVAGGMGTHMVDRATETGIEVVLTRERLIAKALGCYADGTLATKSQLAHSPT